MCEKHCCKYVELCSFVIVSDISDQRCTKHEIQQYSHTGAETELVIILSHLCVLVDGKRMRRTDKHNLRITAILVSRALAKSVFNVSS